MILLKASDFYGKHSFFDDDDHHAQFRAAQGPRQQRPARSSEDIFMGFGGIGSLFKNFFESAFEGMGRNSFMDDPFTHPMAGARPGREHFHRRSPAESYIIRTIIMPDGSVRRETFRVGPREGFDEEVNFDQFSGPSGFNMPNSRAQFSQKQNPKPKRQPSAATRPSTNESDKVRGNPKNTGRNPQPSSTPGSKPRFNPQKRPTVPRFHVRRPEPAF